MVVAETKVAVAARMIVGRVVEEVVHKGIAEVVDSEQTLEVAHHKQVVGRVVLAVDCRLMVRRTS